jgi:hypothetical protein
MTFSVNPLGSTSTFSPSVSTLNNEVNGLNAQAQTYFQQARLGAENRLSYNPPPALASFTPAPLQLTPQYLFGSLPTSSSQLFPTSQASLSGGGTFSGGQGGRGNSNRG